MGIITIILKIRMETETKDVGGFFSEWLPTGIKTNKGVR